MIAIAWNYVFNNAYTYRDQRLAGWAFVRGLIEFELICSVGAISNIGVASLIYAGGPTYRSVALASGSLDGTTSSPVVLGPTATNPLGIFYRHGSLDLKDNVRITGTNRAMMSELPPLVAYSSCAS